MNRIPAIPGFRLAAAANGDKVVVVVVIVVVLASAVDLAPTPVTVAVVFVCRVLAGDPKLKEAADLASPELVIVPKLKPEAPEEEAVVAGVEPRPNPGRED